MTESKAMTRSIRLLYLRDLLKGGRAYSTSELAKLCNVSERTMYRDLADLQGEPLRVPLCDVWAVRDEQ